ncbi:MAG TPA: nucleoside hydrolase [Candidatus Binatia bacterium]|nr:nucleoside hydrolase [Candidatus Binatia bacterium]
MAKTVPILLDTDVGTDVDDAIAIALLLAAPELDLRAVTTVSGDVRLRARIAKKLLSLGGRAEVAVAAGVREPILRRRNFLWLGHEGQGIVSPNEPLTLATSHGVDLFIKTVLRERPQVVTIGPLSNLAVAIMKEPALIAAIPHLTVMGGSIGRAADVPAAEYNLGSDAEASELVLSAGIPTTLVPLDVTFKTFFLQQDLARLRTSPSLLVQTLCNAIEIWAPIHAQFFGATRTFDPSTVAFLHDPLTLAVVFDPSLVTTERLHLQPTLVDGTFRLVAQADAPEFEVATAVDAPRFVEFLLQRLLSLA